MRHLPEILVMTIFMVAGFVTTTACIYAALTFAFAMGWHA